METSERLGATGPGLPDAAIHVARDMILLALDEIDAPALPEVNRLSARAALAEALDVLEGQA